MFLNGTVIYNGYSFGKVFLLKERNIEINNNKLKSNKVKDEINLFIDAYKKTLNQFNNLKKLSSNNKDRKLLFDGYILILKDKLLRNNIINLIKNKLFFSDAAVYKIVNKQIKSIKNVNNVYIKERANDLLDISKRLIFNIKNIELIDLNFLNINDKTIIVTKNLDPSQIIQFDLKKISGLIIEKGSITSHSSIISKSIGLVSILGVKNITKLVNNNDNLIIDSIKGRVYINPDSKIISKFKKRNDNYLIEQNNLLKLKKLSAITYDGHKIKLLANIGNNKDINNIFKYGAEGIGLYRTEFLFMDRDSFPSEDEQFIYYKEIVKLMKDKIVTIRTVDLGGDKFLPYMDFPKENVPFLG